MDPNATKILTTVNWAAEVNGSATPAPDKPWTPADEARLQQPHQLSAAEQAKRDEWIAWMKSRAARIQAWQESEKAAEAAAAKSSLGQRLESGSTTRVEQEALKVAVDRWQRPDGSPPPSSPDSGSNKREPGSGPKE